jgi:hypothetical protein
LRFYIEVNMPRRKPTQSSFVTVDIPNDLPETIGAYDSFLQNEHKITGRGNRADAQGVAELISALQYIRQGTDRLKTKYLKEDELKHPKIITALENLGIFNDVLTKDELRKFKQTGELPPNSRVEILKKCQFFIDKSISYI